MSIVAETPAAAARATVAARRTEGVTGRATGPGAAARAGRVLLNATLLVALLLLAFLAVGPHLLPYRTVTMLTGSMSPTITPGSVVVDTPEPVSALRAGQVVTFHAPEPGRPVVTHRVQSVERRNGKTVIRTRGDANAAVDPWLAEVHGDTVWRVRGVLPHLGDGIRLLRAGQMHVYLTWIVPGAVLLWFIAGVWRRGATDEGGDPCCVDPYPAGRGLSQSSRLRSPFSARASGPGRASRQHRPRS